MCSSGSRSASRPVPEGSRPRSRRALRPAGEVEYNMVLGDYRAEVRLDHLARLGVDPRPWPGRHVATLDAEGKNEEGWQRDRRVDIGLQAAKQATPASPGAE